MTSNGRRRFGIVVLAAAALSSLLARLRDAAVAPQAGLDRIEHIVVIYAENRSFDHLYGLFPGADGIANATPEQYTQVDYDGKPLPHLPPVWKGKEPGSGVSDRTCRTGRSASTRRRSTCRCRCRTRDLIHKFYPQQEQINGGRNNRFAEVSDAGGARRWATTTARRCRCGSGRRNTRSPITSSWAHSAIRTSITSG